MSVWRTFVASSLLTILVSAGLAAKAVDERTVTAERRTIALERKVAVLERHLAIADGKTLELRQWMDAFAQSCVEAEWCREVGDG